MTNLAVAIDRFDGVLTLSAAIDFGSLPAPITIDSEALLVTGGDNQKRISVNRGMNGTAPASHARNATVTEGWSTGGSGGVTPTLAEVLAEGNTTGGEAIGVDLDNKVTISDLGQGGAIIALDVLENGIAEVVVQGLGAQLQLAAADGDATHVGGELSIKSGDSEGQNGGDLTITAGGDGNGGDGGNVTIQSGYATDGESGAIAIKAGGGFDSAVGGDVNIQGGNGQTGNGGDVTIAAGAKVTGGSHGTVQIYSASGTHFLELSETAGFQFFGGKIILDGLPTADPTNAGQLYTDGAPSAGVPKALMVSGG